MTSHRVTPFVPEAQPHPCLPPVLATRANAVLPGPPLHLALTQWFSNAGEFAPRPRNISEDLEIFLVATI